MKYKIYNCVGLFPETYSAYDYQMMCLLFHNILSLLWQPVCKSAVTLGAQESRRQIEEKRETGFRNVPDVAADTGKPSPWSQVAQWAPDPH